ncbi:MAG: hypothetical protein FWD06_03945 [Oscillospiraceae bacterium]|nr:hypothetical protein [Oscillospiraceae bacterium]
MKHLSRIKKIELGIFSVLILLTLGSLLADIQFLPIADILRQLRMEAFLIDPNNGIFQTLAQVQASMSALGLAIVSLLAVISKERLYGVPLTKYLMIYRHWKPFQHGFIIGAIIILSATGWLAVAIGLYNLSVAIFLISTILIFMLAKDAVRALRSANNLEQEIKAYIISSKSYNTLFEEIRKSIVKGDKVLFEENLDFVLEILSIELIPGVSDERIRQIEENIQNIINVAIEHNNTSFNAGVFRLFISAYCYANRDEDNIVSLKLDNYEIYYLLRICQLEMFDNPTAWKKQISLREWQRQIFVNGCGETIASISRRKNLGPASSIATALYSAVQANKNAYHNKQKLCFDILDMAKSLYEHASEQQRPYAETNYLSLTKAFIDAKEEILLNVLFGTKDANIEFQRFYQGVACPHSGRIKLTKVNVFLVLFLYYAAYREELYVEENRNLCREILAKLAQSFEFSFFDNSSKDFGTYKELYEYLLIMLGRFEHWAINTSKFLNYEHVATDFMIFTLTCIFFQNKDELKTTISKIFSDCTRLFLSYHDDKENRGFSRFKQFREVLLKGYGADDEEDYILLKNAIMELYTMQQAEEAKQEAREFDEGITEYIKSIQVDFLQIIEEACDIFTPVIDVESEFERWEHSIQIPINYPKEYIKNAVSTQLYAEILFQLKKNMRMRTIPRGEVSVQLLREQFEGVSVNAVAGGEHLLNWRDPEYKSFLKQASDFTRLGRFKDCLACINTRLVQLYLGNARVNIRTLEPHEIASSSMPTMNSIKLVFADEQMKAEYIADEMRVIEFSLDLAVSATQEYIGGGLIVGADPLEDENS